MKPSSRKFEIVAVVLSLLGAAVSVFALTDRYPTLREYERALLQIDQRLEGIEKRFDRLEEKLDHGQKRPQ